MSSSLLLLGKFVYDIVKRLIHDAYYRSLGSALLLILLAGTLFFWLVEGSAFLYALTYSAMTMAMNSPTNNRRQYHNGRILLDHHR